MRGSTPQDYANNVRRAYRSGATLREAKSVRLSAGQAAHEEIHQPVGHPDFAYLDVGQSEHCDAAAVFVDLTNFTGRSFWDPPEMVVKLSLAVLTQVMDVIVSFGGHILGLRGDGVFACFGGRDSRSPEVDIILALGACAWTLDATQSALNNLLAMDGIEPVQMRVGADYGRLDFVRTGSSASSEVNVLGFAANFAAKCEKTANSWEMVIGEAMGERLNAPELITHHVDSPKRYTRAYETRTYRFYDVRWRSLLPHLEGVRELLVGAPSSTVGIY